MTCNTTHHHACECREAMFAEMEAENARLVAENCSLKEEVSSLELQLEAKSKEIGRSEHRGNTVDYIYDKCRTYGEQVYSLGNENRKLRTEVARLTTLLEKARDALDVTPTCLQSGDQDFVESTFDEIDAALGEGCVVSPVVQAAEKGTESQRGPSGRPFDSP